jgi:hypothetical protein
LLLGRVGGFFLGRLRRRLGLDLARRLLLFRQRRRLLGLCCCNLFGLGLVALTLGGLAPRIGAELPSRALGLGLLSSGNLVSLGL